MGLLSDFEHGVSKAVSTVYSDVKSGVKFVGHGIEKAVTTPEKLLEKGLDTAGSLGKSLAFPLVIIGIPIAILLLRSR